MELVERARTAYRNADYKTSVALFEEYLSSMTPSGGVYLDYADALAQCGRMLDSLDVYSLCARYQLVSVGRLRHVVTDFMRLLAKTGLSEPAVPRSGGLNCPICQGVLTRPVTLNCGHTFCSGCVARERRCRECRATTYIRGLPDTNVLVQTVVEQWFSTELKAAKLREHGNKLCESNRLEEAISKYTAAIDLVPSHLAYSNRSHTYFRLYKLKEALADAEATIRLRPHWLKGHYRRSKILEAMNEHEEAFISLSITVALEEKSEYFRDDLTRALKKLLIPMNRCCRTKNKWNSPYISPSHFLPTVNTSYDLEENSCGEDDEKMKMLITDKFKANRRIHKVFERVFQEIALIKKTKHQPIRLQIERNTLDPTDFDCALCCRTLYRPITTPCGHTYCLSCLERCYDYKTACPLCMTPMEKFFGTAAKNITVWLEDALLTGLPKVYNTQMLMYQQEMTELAQSPDIPLFVCTAAFPTVPCPLFIYEPRYRCMIRRCIESGTRQFAICGYESKSHSFVEYGTMLKIKDCVLMPDGCSLISTVGLSRFRVVKRSQLDGYNTVQVQFLYDTPVPEHQLQELEALHLRVLNKAKLWFGKMPIQLRNEIFRTYGEMPELEEDWSQLDDGPSWLWWLLSILPLGQVLQINILSITSLMKRLRVSEKTLDHLASNREACVATVTAPSTSICSLATPPAVS